MPYAFVQDVPADETIYRRIKELLPTETPAGLVTHIDPDRFALIRDNIQAARDAAGCPVKIREARPPK